VCDTNVRRASPFAHMKKTTLGFPELGAALAFALVTSSAARAGAVTIEQCDFSDTSSLVLNGSAAQSATLLALTDGGRYEAGSAYYGVAIPWSATTSFHTDFQFQMVPNTTGSEGLSFILQSEGTTALGGDSYQIGYGEISPSVEVEFDTYMDSWDPNDNHVAIMSDGDYTTHLAYGTPSFMMSGGGVLYAWVEYDATTTELDVYLSDTPTEPATPIVSTNIAIPGTSLFVGFTSSTGGSVTASEQDVLEWELGTDGIPCACGGTAECSGGTPICATSGPDEGLCIAAPVPDGGAPDGGAPDASIDDASPDAATHDAGPHGGGKPPQDAGEPRDASRPHDGSVGDAGPRHDSGTDAGPNGDRISGGACSSTSVASRTEGSSVPWFVLGVTLAFVRARRRSCGVRP
jgi:hypothetical protein